MTHTHLSVRVSGGQHTNASSDFFAIFGTRAGPPLHAHYSVFLPDSASAGGGVCVFVGGEGFLHSNVPRPLMGLRPRPRFVMRFFHTEPHASGAGGQGIAPQDLQGAKAEGRGLEVVAGRDLVLDIAHVSKPIDSTVSLRSRGYDNWRRCLYLVFKHARRNE